jgi:hypothetical protein
VDISAYFGTNPHLAELLRSQTSVDECIDLLASSEEHAWEGRRTLADFTVSIRESTRSG